MVTNRRAKWLHSMTTCELETMMRNTLNKRCEKRIKLFNVPDTMLDFKVEFVDETKLLKSVTLQFVISTELRTTLSSDTFLKFSKCVSDKYYSYIKTRIEEMLQVYNKIYSKGIYHEKYLTSIECKNDDNITILYVNYV